VRGVWTDRIFPPKSSVIHPDVWLEIIFFSFLDNYMTSGEDSDINLQALCFSESVSSFIMSVFIMSFLIRVIFNTCQFLYSVIIYTVSFLIRVIFNSVIFYTVVFNNTVFNNTSTIRNRKFFTDLIGNLRNIT